MQILYETMFCNANSLQMISRTNCKSSLACIILRLDTIGSFTLDYTSIEIANTWLTEFFQSIHLCITGCERSRLLLTVISDDGLSSNPSHLRDSELGGWLFLDLMTTIFGISPWVPLPSMSFPLA
ncbi:hypothetical protein IG631_09593 [Alternaria alternata]|nr:hypothetical protein IG631_09593 [Alternaria alternata]